jgi:glutamate 5-kinase
MTVVVKLGSSLVLREEVMQARAAEIVALVEAGERVCVVSSGAIALGLAQLGIERRPRSVPRLQAASALGQARLHAAWESALEPLRAAQVLLTAGDVADRVAYVNARNTLNTLLEFGVVPVVNENDVTATDEITFGDNDALAAHVALLVRARLLLLLTEVDGVYSRAPGTPGATLLADGTSSVEFGPGSAVGRGGMRSKVLAAEMAAAAGIPTVIAAGHGDEVIATVVAGEARGTRFPAVDARVSAFKLWLRYGKPPAGRLQVDDGARRALVQEGASLLAVGISSTDGTFGAGDVVELVAADGTVFGKGIASTAAADLQGRSRGLEAVHRDRLVLY